MSLVSGSSGEPLSRLLPRARGFRRGGVPGSRSRSRTDALAAHSRGRGGSFGLIVQLFRWAIPAGIEECSLHAFDACALCTFGPAGHIPLGWCRALRFVPSSSRNARCRNPWLAGGPAGRAAGGPAGPSGRGCLRGCDLCRCRAVDPVDHQGRAGVLRAGRSRVRGAGRDRLGSGQAAHP